MPRVVSFLVLLAIVLLIGSVFFQVMAQFLLPLFLAAVLVVVFKPLHQWVTLKLPSYPRIAALATTLIILLIVLVPTSWLGWNAYVEGRGVFSFLEDEAERQRLVDLFNDSTEQFKDSYENFAGKPFDIKGLLEQATGTVGGILISSVQLLLGLLVGLAIMSISLYYFLADGPAMIHAIMQLSPLEDTYERQLLDRFSDVSRAVVLATMLAAVLQGLVAGIGYYFALPGEAPIFLLTTLTMVFAIVPFVGAAAIWVPTCAYLAFYGERIVADQVVVGNWPVALILAGYCAVVVSNLDNVVKPWVLHGQTNLHPLLALLSVIGGVQALGPIGILVGPMLVAFLQALMNMLNHELKLLGKEADQRDTPGVFATKNPDTPPTPKPSSKKRRKGKGK